MKGQAMTLTMVQPKKLDELATMVEAYGRTHTAPFAIRWRLYEAALAFNLVEADKNDPDREGSPDPKAIVDPDKERAKWDVGRNRDAKTRALLSAGHGHDSSELQKELAEFEKEAQSAIEHATVNAKGLKAFLDSHGFHAGPVLRKTNDTGGKFAGPEKFSAAESEAKKTESGWKVVAQKQLGAKAKRFVGTHAKSSEVNVQRVYDLVLFRTPKGFAFKAWLVDDRPDGTKELVDGRYFLRDGFDVYGKKFARAGHVELPNANARVPEKTSSGES